jgi:hypothetical protein
MWTRGIPYDAPEWNSCATTMGEGKNFELGPTIFVPDFRSRYLEVCPEHSGNWQEFFWLTLGGGKTFSWAPDFARI